MADIIGFMREIIWFFATSLWPLVAIILVVAVLTAVFQAMFQINDSAIAFIPKLLVFIYILYQWGPGMVEKFAEMFKSVIEQMSNM